MAAAREIASRLLPLTQGVRLLDVRRCRPGALRVCAAGERLRIELTCGTPSRPANLPSEACRLRPLEGEAGLRVKAGEGVAE
jgi:hypothetical protein